MTMAIQQLSTVRNSREHSARRSGTWSHDELGCDQPTPPRSTFETILAVCSSFEDPEFHDGWTPVRARHNAEQE
jgi:hypothetical protein